MTRAAGLPVGRASARHVGTAANPITLAAVAAFADRALVGLVLATAVALPLVFSIAAQDVFALPKSVTLWAVSIPAGGLLLVRLAARRPLGIRPTPIGLLVGAFVVLNGVAWWFATDRGHAAIGESLQYQGIASILCYVLFLAVAATTFGTPRRVRLLLAAVVLGAVPVAVYAVIQWLRLDPIWPVLPKGRAFSTLGQANALGAYLVIGAAAAAGLALSYRRVGRLLAVAAFGLMVAGIAFTLSRGAYVAMIAGSLTCAAGLGYLLRKGQAGIPKAGLAIALVVLPLSAVSAAPMLEPFIQRATTTVDLAEDSVRGHFDLWAVGVQIAADHPLVGTGQDSFVLEFGSYRDQVLSPDRAAVMGHYRPESPHNVYLATAVGSGVPSLVVYLGIAVLAAAGLVRRIRQAASPVEARLAIGLLTAIVGHLVTDAFVTAEVTASWLFWVILGAAIGLARPDRSTSADDATAVDRRAQLAAASPLVSSVR